jgi:hypothetical protein
MTALSIESLATPVRVSNLAGFLAAWYLCLNSVELP